MSATATKTKTAFDYAKIAVLGDNEDMEARKRGRPTPEYPLKNQIGVRVTDEELSWLGAKPTLIIRQMVRDAMRVESMRKGEEEPS